MDALSHVEDSVRFSNSPARGCVSLLGDGGGGEKKIDDSGGNIISR